MKLMSVLKDWARIDGQAGSVGRHTILLFSLGLLLVTLPLVRVVPGGEVRFSVLLSLVLFAAIYVNSTQRWMLIVAIIVGGGSIITRATAAATGAVPVQIVADAMSLALLGFTTLLMLNTLMQTEHVSRDTIVGGICVYLLFGLCFTLAYLLATDLGGGALIEAGQPLLRNPSDGSARATSALYFSFVTLTTLGYGDITPTGETVRMLATTEAIVGQLYVAIFIARLVTMKRD